MTAKELLKRQFDDAGYQIEKVFDGVDSSLDFKLTAQAMSPRELATHLAECYFAAQKEAQGEKHSWGTYTPRSTEWPALYEEMKEQRAKAVAIALEAEGWEDHANGYIVAHDYYHVGQMVLIRMKQDASWDPYSIYNWG